VVDIPLTDRKEIALVIGAPPDQIPSSFPSWAPVWAGRAGEWSSRRPSRTSETPDARLIKPSAS